MSPNAEVTRLDATDLGSEKPNRTQQNILDNINVTGTSTPNIHGARIRGASAPSRHALFYKAKLAR